MPELPEVATITDDLRKALKGKEIESVKSSWEKKVLPSLSDANRRVAGKKIEEVTRIGKIICLYLEGGEVLTMHLKMTGQLIVGPANFKNLRHEIKFTDGSNLKFFDNRKFGYIRLYDKNEFDKFKATQGVDPLDTKAVVNLLKQLRKRRLAVKLILTDQKLLAGIGNIYATDALYLAGIKPQRHISTLTDSEINELAKWVHFVLNEGLKYRGASDNTYVDAYGKQGEYQNHFQIYRKKGSPCPKICGGKVERIVIGGRGSYYCPNCQK